MNERVHNHKFQRWMREAVRYEEEWRKGNESCYGYYDGKQWTEGEEAELELRGQDPAVFNLIRPTVDMLSSLEVERRADIQVCGREGSDDDKAQLLTELLKHVFDSCNFDYFHSAAFRDAVIGGRGWMECSTYTNEQGKDLIRVDHVPWENVYCDPFSRKPDASDARFIIKVKWVDRDMLKKLFPASADDIDSVFEPDDFRGQEYEAQNKAGDRGDEKYYDAKTQRVKVCECYYTVPEYETIEVLNEQTGKRQNKEVMKQKLHFVIFSDDVILKGSATDDAANENPFGIDYYPLIPIYGTRDRKGRPRGVIRDLLPLQDILNKLNSKIVHFMGTNRLFIEEDAVNDPLEAHQEVQKPDGLISLRPGGLSKIRVEDKFRDMSFASNYATQIVGMFQRICGVNDSTLGMGGTNERSGIMQTTRISQGNAMQTVMLENMFYSKQRIALVLLRLMGKFYTDYRVMRVTRPNGEVETYEFNVPQVDPATGEPAGVLNDIGDTLYYDVILKKVPPFNSIRERQLMLITEVLKSGVVIPPQVASKIILESIDLPNKTDLLRETEAIYQAAAAPVQGQEQAQPPQA